MKKTSFGRKNLRRTACILTAGMMAFSACALFAGCSKNDDGSNGTAIVDQAEAMKTLSYKVEDLTIASEISSKITNKNGILYAVTTSYEEKDGMYLGHYSIISFDKSGTILSTFPIFDQEKENEWGYVNGGLSVDDNGNITYMFDHGFYDDVTGESENSSRLVTVDPNGTEISSIDIGQLSTTEDQEAGRYFNNYIVDASGYIYCNMSTCVRVLDPSGQVLFTTPEIDSDHGWMNSMILTNAGVPAVSIYEYSDTSSTNKLVEIDVNTKGYGKEHILPTNTGDMYSGSGEYLCYSSSDTGISAVKADTLEYVPVLNLLNLGIDNSQIQSFTICDDGSFITCGYNYNGDSSSVTLSFISPIDASEVKEKKILSLGCFYLDWNIRSQIAEFNKTNEDYTIYVTSFSESNDTTDYTAALTKFNNELLAGNVPDILLLNNSMPYDSYASKGLFTDLYEFIDNDPELTRDSFMPNVLKALESNGKLYSMISGFGVQGYAGKKSVIGDKTYITMDEATAALAKLQEGATLTNNLMDRSSFLMEAINSSGFTDYEKGTCSFDTPEFKAVLETAKGYPAEIDYDNLYNENPNYWMESETACRDGKALLYNAYLYDFESYNRIRYAYFDEDIVFVGFPGINTEGASGACLNFSCQMAVSSKSKFKEGAWEFIKCVINDSVYQMDFSGNGGATVKPYAAGDSLVASSDSTAGDNADLRWVSRNGNFPILIEQMNNLGKQATIPITYTDENGNVVEENNSYWVGDTEIKLPKMTQADVDKVIELLKTVTRVQKYDESVSNIVKEEAQLFFDGSKTADETASIIQSRVSLYMSEQY